MIFDLHTDRPRADERADVCVVGAGAAGIALAVELAARGKSVLLLEGGGRAVEDAAQEPYRSEVVGNVHRGVHTGRVRAHGGTTTKWGGQILQLNDEDFATRAWVAGSGWPFPKQELAGAYERALQVEGLGRMQREDARVWKAVGEPQPRFLDFETYLTRWCPEPNFARLHKDALEGEGVRVWTHANATELLLEGATVRAVRCRTQVGDREAQFHADEFVFCLGSIESVRFFLQPREGGLPWNASGMLGLHFQDHIDANVAEIVPRDRKAFAAQWDNIFLGGHKYHPKMRLAPRVQEREGTLNCGATMAFASNSEETAAAIKQTAKQLLRGRIGDVRASDVAHALRHAPLLLRQAWRYMRAHRAYNADEATVHLRVHCEQEPLSASHIALAAERDSLGMLRTRLDWRIAERELHTLRVAAQHAQKALAASAEVRVNAALLAGDPSFAAACDDSNHHMGGMRMDADPRAGVVSADLLLHGTRNCYVCSGAVFPSSGFSNPTHTVLALAMRLARRLTR